MRGRGKEREKVCVRVYVRVSELYISTRSPLSSDRQRLPVSVRVPEHVHVLAPVCLRTHMQLHLLLQGCVSVDTSVITWNKKKKQ